MATDVDTLAHVAPRQAHHRHFLRPPQLHPSISVIPALKYRQCCWRQLGSVSVVQERGLTIVVTVTTHQLRIQFVLKGTHRNCSRLATINKRTGQRQASKWAWDSCARASDQMTCKKERASSVFLCVASCRSRTVLSPLTSSKSIRPLISSKSLARKSSTSSSGERFFFFCFP